MIAPIVAAVTTVLLSAWMRHWRRLVLVPAAALGSPSATVFGKQLTARARPPHELAVPPFEYSASFPSGHTLNATALAGVVVYLVCLRVRSARTPTAVICLGTVYALAIGLSRAFLGHHWLTDVVAAWFLGCAWLTVVIIAHQAFHLVRRSRAERAAAEAVPDGGGRAPPSSSL